jgi:hypothetical protein
MTTDKKTAARRELGGTPRGAAGDGWLLSHFRPSWGSNARNGKGIRAPLQKQDGWPSKRVPRAADGAHRCNRLAAGKAPFPASVCNSGARGALLSPMRRGVVSLLLFLSGCVTAGAGSPGAVLLEAPDETCERLGPMAVRMSTDLLMSQDALRASALYQLRERAALRGATHLLVARAWGPATVAYTTGATASGVAYRCADWH